MSQKFWRIFSFIFLVLLSSCKEEFPECQGTLKTKSLVQIQNCIEGNWKFLYSTGGFTGQSRIEYENSTIEFRSNATIFWVNEGDVVSDEPIEWSYMEDQLNEFTHIMKYTRTGVPGSWGFQEIRKDTLIIYDVGNDGFIHVLKKL
tara:strand:- start:4 stop:441 length:438 start_codon:yes stop_codon:yes gene_type:complete